jgi:hypothetical protein
MVKSKEGLWRANAIPRDRVVAWDEGSSARSSRWLIEEIRCPNTKFDADGWIFDNNVDSESSELVYSVIGRGGK